MKFRIRALLVALPAVIAGLLVTLPAEAASPSTSISTKYVTMSSTSSTGVGGVVSLKCNTSARCRGTIHFEGSVNRKRSYSVKGRSTATISVTMNKTSASNPLSFGKPTGRVGNQYKTVSNVKLVVSESSPKKATYNKIVRTETRARGRIYYAVKGNDAGLSDMRIELHRVLSGGNTTLVTSREIVGNSTGFISAKLGGNNSPGSGYKLKVRATDDSNRRLSWWWRGTSGNTAGGARYLRESSTVQSTKDGFDTDIKWGTISGKAPAGQTVRVFAPPASFSGGAAVVRELDVPSCANVFGEDRASSGGAYSIPFLPYSGAKNFGVSTTVGGEPVWLGSGGQRFGSCHALLGYSFSRSNLIALSSDSLAGQDLTQAAASKTTNVKPKFSGYSPTIFDKWVRIREKVPGLSVLDTPVVAEGGLASNGVKAFSLPHGQYWVEVGRRTGCSTWYPSIYPNNKAYFNGADRGAEAWKSFTKLASLPGSTTSGLERIAVAHGATYAKQGKSSGKAGWMYRDYCKALGEGTVNSLTVSSSSGSTMTTSTNDKGAVVTGRVSRAGGRTNKEMMVRVSSAAGTLVLRTDLTDSGGTFYVAGLASGRYSISVNSDSWRGIGRSFTGPHTITVKAGRVYSVGTLGFKG